MAAENKDELHKYRVGQFCEFTDKGNQLRASFNKQVCRICRLRPEGKYSSKEDPGYQVCFIDGDILAVRESELELIAWGQKSRIENLQQERAR